jgi:hypothetical protein
VADAGEPPSPQAADLIRRVAQVFLDEPADLMAEMHAAVSAAAAVRPRIMAAISETRQPSTV